MPVFEEKKFLEVINELLAGKSTIEVAKEKNISRKTITNYLKKLQDPKDPHYDPKIHDSILFIREAKYGSILDKDVLDEIIQKIFEGKTIESLEDEFLLSKKTIYNYLQSLKDENSPFYNPELSQRITQVEKKYQKIYARMGGLIGKRGRIRDDQTIQELAQSIIKTHETLQVISEKYHIPVSTLYDNVMSIESEEIQNDLQTVFYENKR